MKPIRALLLRKIGGASGPVQLDDATCSVSGNGSVSKTATYTIASDGNVYNQNGTKLEQWLLSGSASAYEIEAVLVSGNTPTGTLNSWLSLGTTQSWSLSGIGNFACQLTVSIRMAAAPNTVLASATIAIDVTNTP